MSGAGAAGGLGYQNLAAAWLASKCLAEAAAQLPWDLNGVELEHVWCEQDQLPVDDLVAATSAGGFIFIQSKKTLINSPNPESELASALGQFVRLHLAAAVGPDLPAPWNRLLDSKRDRLILLVGPTASGAIRNDLKDLLTRMRNLAPGQALMAACTTESQRDVWTNVVSHLQTAWRGGLGIPASEDDLRGLIDLIRVEELALEAGQSAEREAKMELRVSVLADPGQVEVAWDSLVHLAQQMATTKSGRDRAALQSYLAGRGIGLRAVLSNEADIRALTEHSKFLAGVQIDLARLRLAGQEIRIHRAASATLATEWEKGSLLIVGEPGAGKSGCLHDLATELIGGGRDVVYLSAERLGGLDVAQPFREGLNLRHDLWQVLKAWPGKEPAALILDGLDAARSPATGQALKDLISWVGSHGGRWRVVASIRKFDLRYSETYRTLFQGEAAAGFIDPEFKGTRHLNVPALMDAELDQVKSASPMLEAVLGNASPALLDLLRNPFNLAMVAKILTAGVTPAQLQPLRTQGSLLDAYWKARVLNEANSGDAKETLLNIVCSDMVSHRRLWAERPRGLDAAGGLLLSRLLQDQILQEWAPAPGVPDRGRLQFPHNILFDYAISRVVVPRDPAEMEAWLGASPDLVLFLRPSLAMYLLSLWEANRGEFWTLALHLAGSKTVPKVAKVVAPAVLVDVAAAKEDLEPLYDLVAKPGLGRDDPAAQLLRHLTGALLPGAKS